MNPPQPRVASRPRRVLHVNRVSFLGGVERVILTLATGVNRHGYKATLACPAEDELPQVARARGLDVVQCQFDRMRITANPLALARYPSTWLRGAAQVLQYCADRKIDIIHAHHPVGVLYSIRAKRELGIPIIFHVHEILPAKVLYRLALHKAVKYVDRFACVSQASRELLSLVDVDPVKVEIVHNGVDPSFLSASTRRPPEVSTPGPHIGVFGVIEPRKGQHVFLRAARRLAQMFPSAHFWVVGSVALKDKAGYYRLLQSIADQPALAGRVTFTGHQSDVAAWMQAMDVVALSSVAYESLSMVLLEALMLGKPTVGTAVGGTTEAIEDGYNGRVVQPGDDIALADAILDLLGDAGQTMAHNAAADASRRFAPEAFCRRFAGIYDAILDNKER